MADKSAEERWLDVYRDITRKQNEHQISYNKTIFGLGYGGALGIWALMRNEITPLSAAIIGVLLIVSLATYLSFEIAMMIVSMKQSTATNAALDTPGSVDDKLAAYFALQQKISETHRTRLDPAWFVSIIVSVASAFGAAIYLTVLLVLKLFEGS